MDLQRRRRSPEGMSAAGEFLALPDREESAEHTGQLSVAGAASEETPVLRILGLGQAKVLLWNLIRSGAKGCKVRLTSEP